MMSVFSFRLDEATRKKLQFLAKQTQRSRGNVIRWLINTCPLPESRKRPMQPETAEMLSDNKPKVWEAK